MARCPAQMVGLSPNLVTRCPAKPPWLERGAVTIRLLFGYALLLILIAGCAYAYWRWVHNSRRNVARRRHRARHAGDDIENAAEDSGSLE